MLRQTIGKQNSDNWKEETKTEDIKMIVVRLPNEPKKQIKLWRKIGFTGAHPNIQYSDTTHTQLRWPYEFDVFIDFWPRHECEESEEKIERRSFQSH